MPPTPKAPGDAADGEDDFWVLPYDELAGRAQFMAMVCKVSGVAADRYEEWLDSMSPEYFALHCDAVFEKKSLQFLMRAL